MALSEKLDPLTLIHSLVLQNLNQGDLLDKCDALRSGATVVVLRSSGTRMKPGTLCCSAGG